MTTEASSASADVLPIEAEAVVVGGGLAGSAAAIALAQAGRSVVLLERAAQPQHKVCGEFLSAEALGYLKLLGVDLAPLDAVPISAMRVAGRHGVAQAPLPFAALSLTRRCLDEALLLHAYAAGAVVLRGSGVRSLRASHEAWLAERDAGRPVLARAAFLATGKHDLRGRSRPKGSQSDLVAFKMYWHLKPAQAAALNNHVEIALFPGGYAGLQPVEGEAANLCCVVRRGVFRQMGGNWEALLVAMQAGCAHLAERLEGATPLLKRPLAVSSIPYGWIRERAPEPNLWALGDQAAVIPSFTGDGMSIALHSGCVAAASYLRGEPAGLFQRRLAGSLHRHVSLATAVSRVMVRGHMQPLLEAAIQLWPGALGLLARNTRIPANHRLA